MSWFGRSTSHRFDNKAAHTPGPGHYEVQKAHEIGSETSSLPFAKSQRFAPFNRSKRHTFIDSNTPTKHIQKLKRISLKTKRKQKHELDLSMNVSLVLVAPTQISFLHTTVDNITIQIHTQNKAHLNDVDGLQSLIEHQRETIIRLENQVQDLHHHRCQQAHIHREALTQNENLLAKNSSLARIIEQQKCERSNIGRVLNQCYRVNATLMKTISSYRINQCECISSITHLQATKYTLETQFNTYVKKQSFNREIYTQSHLRALDKRNFLASEMIQRAMEVTEKMQCETRARENFSDIFLQLYRDEKHCNNALRNMMKCLRAKLTQCEEESMMLRTQREATATLHDDEISKFFQTNTHITSALVQHVTHTTTHHEKLKANFTQKSAQLIAAKKKFTFSQFRTQQFMLKFYQRFVALSNINDALRSRCDNALFALKVRDGATATNINKNHHWRLFQITLQYNEDIAALHQSFAALHTHTLHSQTLITSLQQYNKALRSFASEATLIMKKFIPFYTSLNECKSRCFLYEQRIGFLEHENDEVKRILCANTHTHITQTTVFSLLFTAIADINELKNNVGQNQSLIASSIVMRNRLGLLDAQRELTDQEAKAANRLAIQLENRNASLVGHHNPEQRIHLHEKIKKENQSLRNSNRSLRRQLLLLNCKINDEKIDVKSENMMRVSGKENSVIARRKQQQKSRSRSLSRSRFCALKTGI